MPSDWIVYACLAAGLSCGLVAGAFQTFSDFVMRSLAAARPAGGIESMQMINREVYRSLFLAMFLGLAPASLGLAIYAYARLAGPGLIWIVAGASVYFVSVFLVTMLGNVPMNKRLDGLDPFNDQTNAYWQTYRQHWTQLNHVRTLGSIVTAVCFLFAGVALA